MTEYRGHTIEEDRTGIAPRNSRYHFFLKDDEIAVGSGESIVDCQDQINELLLNEEEEKEPINPIAFPMMEHGYDRHGCPTVNTYAGMSLKDYFAGKVIQSYVSNHLQNKSNDKLGWSVESMVDSAYVIAEAMLRRRQK